MLIFSVLLTTSSTYEIRSIGFFFLETFGPAGIVLCCVANPPCCLRSPAALREWWAQLFRNLQVAPDSNLIQLGGPNCPCKEERWAGVLEFDYHSPSTCPSLFRKPQPITSSVSFGSSIQNECRRNSIWKGQHRRNTAESFQVEPMPSFEYSPSFALKSDELRQVSDVESRNKQVQATVPCNLSPLKESERKELCRVLSDCYPSPCDKVVEPVVPFDLTPSYADKSEEIRRNSSASRFKKTLSLPERTHVLSFQFDPEQGDTTEENQQIIPSQSQRKLELMLALEEQNHREQQLLSSINKWKVNHPELSKQSGSPASEHAKPSTLRCLPPNCCEKCCGMASIDRACSICLQEYEPGQVLGKLNCCHIFHKECMEGWTQRHNKCPLCKGVLSAYESHRCTPNNFRFFSSGFGLESDED